MDPLFQPIVINKLEIKNRIYMPAMHLNMCVNFEVGDNILAFYAERAKGGAGAVCVGFCTVDPVGGMPMNIGAHDDRFIPGLSRLASAIKDNGSRAAAQINHAGRNAYKMALPKGEDPVAPSAVKSAMTGDTPRELTGEEVARLIRKHADAAGRLRAAGFDMVELLAGTGYLVSSFLSPLTNKRTDEWGGPAENRMRFGVEVVRAIRETVGPDFPVLVRMNGNDMMEGGLRSPELRDFARALEKAGTDAFCVNVGWHEARVPQITMGVPRANFAYLAREIRRGVKKPVIASHRINDPDDARKLIRDGFCDMAAMGRPLIADPALPAKAMDGREEEILHCIACGQGCLDRIFMLQPVECLCNPEAGHELDLPIVEAETKRNVAVVGGGPAGMAAALAAHRRGHRVTVIEKKHELGGQLNLAAIPAGREEFGSLARDYQTLLKKGHVRIVLGREADPAMLKEGGFDAVVLATGARPLEAPIKGADLPHVVQAWDVLSGKAETGEAVAVVGGGAVGLETALHLAQIGTLPGETLKFLLVHQAESPEELRRLSVEGSKRVTLIEMLAKVGRDVGKSTRWTMLQDLKRYGVRTFVERKVVEITEKGVVLGDKSGGLEEIPADTVVLALGSRSENPLEEALKKEGVETHVVGDARRVALAFDAIHEGYKAGRSI